MVYVMGIDGGGSTVRAAVMLDDLTVIGQATGSQSESECGGS